MSFPSAGSSETRGEPVNQARINDMIAETIERIVKSKCENAYVVIVSIDCLHDSDGDDNGDMRIRIPDSVSDAGLDLVVDLYRIHDVKSMEKSVYNGHHFWRIVGKNRMWLAHRRDGERFSDAGLFLADRRETAVKIISSRFLNICRMPMSDDAMKFLDFELSVAGIFP